ncbi:MAG: TetR family transcriptional regulator [Peptococcaceae bacterium]|nr:TetR family transcriptional regulator [Peptococcaceae bacterium]
MAGVTKQMIAEAYLAAAEEKPIDKVTVKDVVETCGITRQTFYYHFQDLLDVLEWIISGRMEVLVKKVLAADSPQTALRVLVDVTLDEKPMFMQELLRSRKREDAERIFFSAVRDFLETLMRHSTQPLALKYTSDLDTALTFYACAIVGVLLEAARKPVVDRDVLADQLTRLITGQLLPTAE